MESFAKFFFFRQFGVVIASIFLACALVGSVFYLKKNKEQKSDIALLNGPSIEAVTDATKNLSDDVADIDTDHDGLKDWEEVLWETDPKNPDTDHDGTPDGEEVRLGRNPLVKGPNDSLKEVSKNISTASSAPIVLTPTDIVARDFFSKYLEAKQTGKDIDAKTQEEIIASVISRQDLVQSAKAYSKEQLTISTKNDEASLRAYGNAMGLIFKNTATWKESEIDIMQEALNKNDEKRLEALDTNINGYQSILNQSLKVVVPSKAVDVHLRYINAYSKIVTALTAMKNTFKDPVSALILLGKYPDAITELHQSFIDARSFFTRNNITFDLKTETGIFFANFADAVDIKTKENAGTQ